MSKVFLGKKYNTLSDFLRIDKNEKTIYIPKEVTDIAFHFIDSFDGCDNITRIEVEEGNTKFYSVNNCLLRQNSDKGDTLLFGCKNSVIPNTVDCISGEAFCNCKELTEIDIPSSVKIIGYGAFENCTSLKSVVLPIGLKRIDAGAFKNCYALSKVEILSNIIKRIDNETFKGCRSLKSIELPDSVKLISTNAFYGCESLETVKMPKKLERIYCGAFKECKSLKSISLPQSVLLISDSVFSNCESLENIILPEKDNKIRFSTFDGCKSLKTINIPYGVKEIENYAFSGCDNLQKVIIPESVTKIGAEAFSHTNPVIYAANGSYAESYARNKRIGFSAIDYNDADVQTKRNIKINVDANALSELGNCMALLSKELGLLSLDWEDIKLSFSTNMEVDFSCAWDDKLEMACEKIKTQFKKTKSNSVLIAFAIKEGEIKPKTLAKSIEKSLETIIEETNCENVFFNVYETEQEEKFKIYLFA